MSPTIDSVRVHRVDLPRADPTWRTATYSGSTVVGFVIEITAGSTVGLGATAAHPLQITPEALETQLAVVVVPTLTGADLLDGSAIRERLRAAGLHNRTFLAADLALHDLLGRLAGLPCFALWGGRGRDQVEVIRMVGLKEPTALLASVDELLEAGFRHVKVKIGGELDDDVRRVSTLRTHVGPDVWLAVDGNGAYGRDDAIRLSRRLADLDVRVLEQPIPYEDVEGLRAVTAVSPVPIMADQCVTDAASAAEVCRRQAAHLVSVKLTKMGSVGEVARVVAVCSAFGVGVHLGGSAAPALVDMAAAHLVLATTAIAAECEVGEFQSVLDDPLRGVDVVDGHLVVGEEPGFGVALGPPGS